MTLFEKNMMVEGAPRETTLDLSALQRGSCTSSEVWQTRQARFWFKPHGTVDTTHHYEIIWVDVGLDDYGNPNRVEASTKEFKGRYRQNDKRNKVFWRSSHHTIILPDWMIDETRGLIG